jgi:maltose O-acetyltransferase
MIRTILKAILKLVSLPLRMLIKVILRMQTITSVRVQFGDVFEALRQSAHANNIERAKRKYNIHPSVYWGEDTLVYGDGKIYVGENTYFGRYSFILSHPVGIILKIGKHCAISHGVHIRTEQNKKKAHYKEDLSCPPLGADIVIGDYVWIGAHSFIRGGITIGSNSIIGANSVVTHDIPANTVYGGVPARFIRYKDSYRIDQPVNGDGK